MTTRIELRKEQQRTLTPNTDSLGYYVGECVRTFTDLNLDLSREGFGLILTDDGFAIRAVRDDFIPETIDASKKATTTFGLTLDPQSPLTLWRKASSDGVLEFDEYGVADFVQVFVTLESGVRPTVKRTITRGTGNTYIISDEPTLPVWTGAISNADYDLSTARVIATYNTRSELESAMNALLDQRRNRGAEEFGDLVDTHNLDLNPQSSFVLESNPAVPVYPFPTYREVDGKFLLHLLTALGNDNFNQISGWQPPNTETKTGTPPFIGKDDLVIPEYLSVDFQDEDGVSVEVQQKEIPTRETGTQTILIQRLGTTPTPRFTVSVGSDNKHKSWLRGITATHPRTLKNLTTNAYEVSSTSDRELGSYPIQLFGHAKPISIPSHATLSGERPHQYLSYGIEEWDGTFKQSPCRCPAWILWDVLTNPRYGINLKPSAIDADSFVEASKYCNELLPDGKPRWMFDGLLSGNQSDIIADLLRLMRGWFLASSDGTFRLRVDQHRTADWIVSPCVVEDGRLDYRSANTRPAVRASYIDRETGLEALTSGLSNSTFIEVPWQDRAVCERWAKFETYAQQNLLDTVEFVLPPSYWGVSVGDIVEIYDPRRAGIRASGRVTENGPSWVRLDSFPLDFFPRQTADARLIPTPRNAAIDEDLWGYVTFRAPSDVVPSLRFQKPEGGYGKGPIFRVHFKPGFAEENRVLLYTKPSFVTERTVWAIEGVNLAPTRWRVQSVSEIGNNYRVVATKQVDGLHDQIEKGEPLPTTPTVWKPACGTALFRFDGKWDALDLRYPSDRTKPWDDTTKFDDLTSSCV